MKNSHKTYTIHVLFTICLILIASCGNKSAASADKTGHEETEGHAHNENSMTAELTADQIKTIGIETGTIEQKQLTASLRANGILKVPNQNMANVTSLYGGVVKSLTVQVGEYVRKGEVIATIANPQFIQLQEEYLTVRSKITLSELENNRQKELSAGNAGTAKIQQGAEAELKILRTREASLQQQLGLMGIQAANLVNANMQSSLTVKSPIDGVVSKVMVKMGAYVDANIPVAEIIDNSQIHLDLFVYEKDLGKLRTGQIIHFTLTNNAGREYDAEIYGISNSFEDNSKAIAVHCKVKGDKTGLIDGMNITALVSLEEANVPAVPTDAIVSVEGSDYIFIVKDAVTESAHHEEGEDAHGHSHEHEHAETAVSSGSVTYERIPVAKGTTDLGYSEITLLKEIPKNARVVTKGAFFILAKQSNTGGHEH
jgi:cobalt-zinc-cadmium efflux system membrane fusion protein